MNKPRTCGAYHYPTFLSIMKFILPLAVLSAVLLSACGKQEYTCVCKDLKGARQDKRYDMETRVQSKAVEECHAHETELNQSISSYSCNLE